MAPKTRQGGAQKASEKQVVKKRLHTRKNYCIFSEKSRIWGDLGRHMGPKGVPLGSKNRYFLIRSVFWGRSFR